MTIKPAVCRIKKAFAFNAKHDFLFNCGLIKNINGSIRFFKCLFIKKEVIHVIVPN